MLETLLLALLAFVCGLGVQRFVLDSAGQAEADDERDVSGSPATSDDRGTSRVDHPVAEVLAGLSASTDAKSASTIPPIYAVASRLEAFYGEAAHPGDLLAHEAFRAGVELLRDEDVPLQRLLWYAVGDNAVIGVMALSALKERPERDAVTEDLLAALGRLGGWGGYFALQVLAGAPADAAEGDVSANIASRVLSSVGPNWEQPFLDHALEEFIAQRVACGEVPHFSGHGGPDSTTHWLARLLGGVDEAHGTSLFAELAEWSQGSFDADFLRTFGRVVETSHLRLDDIVRDERTLQRVDVIERLVCREPARSLALIGEPGVGRSTALELAKARLLKAGWTLFEAGAVEILAGQVYIGELEERIKRMLGSLQSGSQVLWLVPSLQALSFAGRHRQNPTSILDMVLPYVESGSIRIVAEVEPAAYERLVVTRPQLKAMLVPLAFGPYDEGETLALAAAWAAHRDTSMTEQVLRETYHLAEQFLDQQEPGRLLDFLRMTSESSRDENRGDASIGKGDLSVPEVMQTLSALTGLPLSILDEDQSLDLDGLQQFFFGRVMGQPEAVACLVERVAMIKAGLTDPTRPLGVYLFTGPTGTGKTELAKALAEFLFGSPDRMIRVDMSEFQVPGSEERLLRAGRDGESSGALVQVIRQQPFSVILLDEFEKAHEGVWDLFLQVFDDGRLTDTEGNVADFRHAIVILTSNLGADVDGEPIGFGQGEGGESSGPFDDALLEVFRREFLNRLDRVVVFRRLGASVMREILVKELDAVLSRRGLRNRQWAVEWDASALEFLLEQGFSTTFGARRLKRAIDRHLLAPLATTIVTHQVPDGDQFLFVRSDGERLEVEFVDPDGDDSGLPILGGLSAEPSALTCSGLALDGRGAALEVAYLRDVYTRLVEVVEAAPWKAAKQSALDAFSSPEFWRTTERFAILGDAEYRDRIEAGLRTAGSLLNRLAGEGPQTRKQFSSQIVRRLAHQLYLLEAAQEDVRDGTSPDAFLSLESARDSLTDTVRTDGFAARLRVMYESWAKRRGMHLTVLESGSDPWCVIFAISGLAATRLLRLEQGEHVLDGDEAVPRARVRVVVAAQSVVPVSERDGSLLREARAACESATAGGTPQVVRRYRDEPSPLVRDSVRGWRTGRLDRVLGGEFDLFSESRPVSS